MELFWTVVYYHLLINNCFVKKVTPEPNEPLVVQTIGEYARVRFENG